MARQVVWTLTLMMLLAVATSAPADQAIYKDQPGGHECMTVENHTFKSADRDVPLRIAVPSGEGKHPLLIWCHGAMGSKDGYQPLVQQWVSHGYVVIQPTFGDSLAYLDEQQRRALGTLKAAVNSPHVALQWNKRPREVSQLIDALDQLERDVPLLTGRIDRNRIAVGGHSYGAHTSMLLGGVEPRVGWRRVSFLDKRIKAVLLVSPSGSTRILTGESFKRLSLPALVITGDNDDSPIKGQEGKKGAWRREVYDRAPAGDKYLLWINDAHHNFGGITGPAKWTGAGPANAAQVELVTSTCLAFLDAYVRGDADAKAYLAAAQKQVPGKAPATLSAR